MGCAVVVSSIVRSIGRRGVAAAELGVADDERRCAFAYDVTNYALRVAVLARPVRIGGDFRRNRTIVEEAT